MQPRQLHGLSPSMCRGRYCSRLIYTGVSYVFLSIKKASDSQNRRNDHPNGKKKSSEQRQSNVGLGGKAPEVFEFAPKKDDLSFEDKLLRFMQDSDERIQDLKRNTENKRSGGYKRAY